MYDGPPKPDSEKSIVRLLGQAGIVQKIDGKEAGVKGIESHAYLLPGDHTFEIKMMRIQDYHILCGALCDSIFNRPRVVRARTEGGHSYAFKALNLVVPHGKIIDETRHNLLLQATGGSRRLSA